MIQTSGHKPTPYDLGYQDGLNVYLKHTQYKCKSIKLIPPKDFLLMNVQTDDKVDKVKYKNFPIPVDACIADEIQTLWNNGIRTCGCCCGHGHLLGYIEVEEEDIPKMEQMGYCHYIYPDLFGGAERKDAFIPKSGQVHIYDGYIRWV